MFDGFCMLRWDAEALLCFLAAGSGWMILVGLWQALDVATQFTLHFIYLHIAPFVQVDAYCCFALLMG